MTKYSNKYSDIKFDPILTIGVASEMVKLSPETLRLYERGGLLCPARTLTGRRMYSYNDIEWINCIRNLITERGLNILNKINDEVVRFIDIEHYFQMADKPHGKLQTVIKP